MSFGINPFFLIRPCFLNDQKVKPSFFWRNVQENLYKKTLKGEGIKANTGLRNFWVVLGGYRCFKMVPGFGKCIVFSN